MQHDRSSHFMQAYRDLRGSSWLVSAPTHNQIPTRKVLLENVKALTKHIVLDFVSLGGERFMRSDFDLDGVAELLKGCNKW